MSEEMAFDTHSIAWMVHGEAAPVLPDRRTAGKTMTTTDFLECSI